MNLETPPVDPASAEPVPAPTPTAPKVPGSLLSSIRVIHSTPGNPAPTEEPDPKTHTPPTNPAHSTEQQDPKPAPEPKEKLPEATPDPKAKPKEDLTTGMSEKAAHRFRRIEKDKEEAEKARDAANKELETHRAELEALKKQASELESIRKEAEKAIGEAKTYREQLRQVAIERDPEFQKQYNGKILSRQEAMLDLAVSAGAGRSEFVQAINDGNEDALEEFRTSLSAHQQRAWDNHRLEIDKLVMEKREAIGDPEKTWQQIEQDRQARGKQEEERIRTHNIETARAAVDAIKKQVGTLDKDGLAEFDRVQEWLERAVSEAPREDLIQHLAVGQIAQRVVDAQKGEIDRLSGEVDSKQKEIDELKEKLGEQETFIKNASSRVPRPSGTGNPSSVSENGSLLSSVRVHLPGR